LSLSNETDLDAENEEYYSCLECGKMTTKHGLNENSVCWDCEEESESEE
jgi:hypothetical protein